MTNLYLAPFPRPATSLIADFPYEQGHKGWQVPDISCTQPPLMLIRSRLPSHLTLGQKVFTGSTVAWQRNCFLIFPLGSFLSGAVESVPSGLQEGTSGGLLPCRLHQ